MQDMNKLMGTVRYLSQPLPSMDLRKRIHSSIFCPNLPAKSSMNTPFPNFWIVKSENN